MKKNKLVMSNDAEEKFSELLKTYKTDEDKKMLAKEIAKWLNTELDGQLVIAAQKRLSRPLTAIEKHALEVSDMYCRIPPSA